MSWFDILKYQQVEPHDIVTRRYDLLDKVRQLPEFKNKGGGFKKMAKNLKWSLINAAFFNTPIPSKERILLRRLIPYTEMGDESRVFNNVSVAGNRGIRKLPFNLEKGKIGLQGNSSKSFRRHIYALFKLEISEKETKFILQTLHINDWYTINEVEITKDTAEFIRIWKYMAGYTNVTMDLMVWPWPGSRNILTPYEAYRKFGLPDDFASTGVNVSKAGLDKFIENVRKHYLDIEAEIESRKFAPQKPFDIGFIHPSNEQAHRRPKGDEE